MDESKVKLIEIADRLARGSASDAIPDYLQRFRVFYRHLWVSVDARMDPGEMNPLLEMTDKEVAVVAGGR